MDFTIKIKEAMELLREACKMNNEWTNCAECPFYQFCVAIEEHGLGNPCDDIFLEYIEKEI